MLNFSSARSVSPVLVAGDPVLVPSPSLHSRDRRPSLALPRLPALLGVLPGYSDDAVGRSSASRRDYPPNRQFP